MSEVDSGANLRRLSEDAPRPESETKLRTLDLGRGVAALLVLLYHDRSMCMKYVGAVPRLSIPFVGGHAGVEYFFVLSGFLIFWIHRQDIGAQTREAATAFFFKRFLRIIPMYWLVISLMLASFLLHPTWGGDKGLTLQSVAGDYLLLPHAGEAILPPSWTLKREVLFYAIFGLAILAPRVGVLLFCAWQAAVAGFFVLGLAAGGPSTEILYLTDIHNIGFGAGVLCALAIRKLPLRSLTAPSAILALGLALVVATMYHERLHFDVSTGEVVLSAKADMIQSALYTLGFAGIIFAVVKMEQAGVNFANRFGALLGASSYLLYIVHEPLASLVMKLLLASHVALRIGANACYVVEVVVAVAAAIVLHLLVEKPVTRWLRRRFLHGAAGAPRPGLAPLPSR